MMRGAEQRGSITIAETAIALTLALALMAAVADVRGFTRRADGYDRCLVQADAELLAAPDFDRARCP